VDVKPQFKTMAEQKLEWLESLDRPLTDEESEELRRSLHAVYCRNRRYGVLAQHRNEELELLGKLRAEAQMKSPLS
jgi:hypothetical protein